MSSLAHSPTRTILPSIEFDAGTTTAAPDVQSCMRRISAEMRRHRFDLDVLCLRTKQATLAEAPALLTQLHNAAAILFLQWTRCRQDRDHIETLAFARLFNGVTRDARLLHKRFHLFETAHIEAFQQALSRLALGDVFEPEQIAVHMRKAALAHTHERAWAWVVLPTFARQPYGRILLFKVDVDQFEHPIFVTQPTFLTGQCTLFHTHGQNWAYSAPLGAAAGRNTHLNSLWMPRERDVAFPLNLEDLAEYRSGDVAIVPPRLIHGISRKRCSALPIPSLPNMLRNRQRCQDWIDQARFGEQSCLHVYCPDTALHHHLANSPFVKENNQFFIEYDMIVFDHYEESIWCGGGGSWPRRMIEFGTTGEHCGVCFEDDPRKENLDPSEVYDWFIESPAPPLIKYSGQEKPSF